MTQDDWARAIVDTAASWQDPEAPEREAAVGETLDAENRFTEEGLTFALNHLMHQLRPGALREVASGGAVSPPSTVGVVCSSDAPLDGLAAVLAAVSVGHQVVVSLAPESPALLPAFFEAVAARAGSNPVRFVPLAELFAVADAVVASGDSEAVADLTLQAEAADIPSSRRWLMHRGTVAAVVDGDEDAEQRSGLAEDLLLHEGVALRAPSIVWAPAGLSPDKLLDTLAGFRELYPAHPDTDGALRMPTAFLASAKQPHATGPGFLLSKGPPEPQGPAHIRWATYESIREVSDWLRANGDAVEFIVASEPVRERLETETPGVGPGDAHRAPLWEPALIAFLKAL